MMSPDADTAGLGPVMALSESPGQRVMRQLLEALMFEGVIGYGLTRPGAAGWQWLSFTLGALEGRCLGRVRGFGRLRLDLDTLMLTVNGRRAATDLSTLASQLPTTEAGRDRLLYELLATVANTRRLDAMRHSYHLANRRQLHGEDLDRALHEGHPYHPCYKSRLGMRENDLLRYSPETSAGFRLHWLALPRARLTRQLPVPEMAFWQAELGAEGAYLLRAAFHRAGLDWQHHGPLPAHPWHWQALSQSNLAPMLASLDIHGLGPVGDRYRPSQSLRSLFNMSDPTRACIKLPLGIHNTSSRRHLEPHSVPSAPVISQWLQSVVDADPRFARAYPLRLLPEYASLAFSAGEPSSREALGLEGELAAIWRSSIATRLAEDEQTIPLNALAQWEQDGLPFIHPWVELYGLQPWLEATLATVILPVWHMLAAHGIGLEAHGQNSLLVVRNGWPQALILRDFHDSVEYARDYLPSDIPEPDFGPRQGLYSRAPDNQFYRMSGPEALRELVMDTLFIYNLSELALVLQEAYGFDERRFWRHIHRLLANYGAQHPALRPRLAKLGWDRPWIRTESLLRRKLQTDAASTSHQVPNALTAEAPLVPKPINDYHQERLS